MTIDVRELAQKIDEGFAQSMAGEVVVIVDGDTPKVKLVLVGEQTQVAEPLKERVLGLHPGAFEIADNFDDELGDEFWGLKS